MSEETIELLGDAGATARQEHTMSPRNQDVYDEAPADPADPADSTGDAAPEEPEPLSPDQVRERRTLVRRIARYKKVFPEEVSELGTELEGLMYKSPEELAALLEEVQFLVETRRSTAQARGLFLAGLTMGEASGGYVGLKLQGLTATAASSEELLRSVDEVALKYEGVVQLDPAARLLMAVGQLVLAVDASNRARESQPQQASAPVPTNNIIAREEFSDL